MKLLLAEYGRGIDASSLQIAPSVDIKALVERANRVIQRSLRIKRSALVVSDGRLRALGVAGTIRLSRDIELEIVPKMFGGVDGGIWKESLFLLSALSKYGNILSNEHIHSSTAYQNSLYDIAGRILAREYAAHRRKPVRQYRRERFRDFSIEGEIDFESAFEKDPDGIPQERISFDKVNPYNAAVRAAMQTVTPHVKDPATRLALARAIEELGPQSAVIKKRLRVPSRSRDWADIYNLSFDIVSGMGSSLESGEIMSPGFIVDTWRIWEWLITAAMKIGLGSSFDAVPQAAAPWGVKRTVSKTSAVKVFPDVAVYERGAAHKLCFLVDAKYKTFSEKQNAEIERSDLYEAFAFCHAAGAKRLFLAYPAPVDDGHAPGSVTLAADYETGDIVISAVKVAFGSIAKQGDIIPFCRRAAEEILAAAT